VTLRYVDNTGQPTETYPLNRTARRRALPA